MYITCPSLFFTNSYDSKVIAPLINFRLATSVFGVVYGTRSFALSITISIHFKSATSRSVENPLGFCSSALHNPILKSLSAVFPLD